MGACTTIVSLNPRTKVKRRNKVISCRSEYGSRSSVFQTLEKKPLILCFATFAACLFQLTQIDINMPQCHDAVTHMKKKKCTRMLENAEYLGITKSVIRHFMTPDIFTRVVSSIKRLRVFPMQ